MKKNTAACVLLALAVSGLCACSHAGSLRSTRVRFNFQKKTYDNRGAVMEIVQVQDQKFYQEFLAKIDKGIFLAKEKL